jgi:diaminopimelate decarboxylase
MKKNEISKLFSEIMSRENAAFFIDQCKFEKNLLRLRTAFLAYYPKVSIGYSYKTNYVPSICKAAHKLGCWAEVVSSMEVEMALSYLNKKSNIIFNGPVKSTESIKKVIEVGGIINIDNNEDLDKIEEILSKPENQIEFVKVAIRLNFEYDQQPSRFGIEILKIEEFISRIYKIEKLKLIGYHLHLPFRSLASFIYRIECICEVLNIHGNRPLEYINIGGGFYGEINPELAKNLNVHNIPTFEDYGYTIGKMLSNYFEKSKKSNWPELFIEPGSSVVADALHFLCKIHAHKEINGKHILISYCGRHLLTPTNKSLQFPITMYLTSDSLLNSIDGSIGVVGYTCIETDIIGYVNESFNAATHDFVVVSNVGSYSVVMGSDFILPQPAIYNFSADGLKIVRPSRSAKSIMSEFVFE